MSLYSIKVRTSLQGNHVSGAERIVSKDKIPDVVRHLLQRQSAKDFDFSNVKIEKLKEKPLILEKSLKIEEKRFTSWQEGLDFAARFLSDYLKIEKNTLEKLIKQLYEGASPDKKNMRGAMVVSTDGLRLEKDPYRGVRTVLVDFVDRERIEEKLLSLGFTPRTVDALAISTKNLAYPDILAEFCISDDSDYTTGYIAIKDKYIRVSPLKPYGLPKGGRVYFVKSNTDIDKLYLYLENTPVLIEDVAL